ncbi:hypothetical protein SMG44B_20773 [Stenotrophomonas maltophilia]|nr:hypothetical protein BN1263200001 [Stenotrophomonas maltophilia]
MDWRAARSCLLRAGCRGRRCGTRCKYIPVSSAAASMPRTVPQRLPLQPPSNMAAEADANVKGNIKNECRIKIRLLQLQATITPRMHGSALAFA